MQLVGQFRLVSSGGGDISRPEDRTAGAIACWRIQSTAVYGSVSSEQHLIQLGPMYPVCALASPLKTQHHHGAHHPWWTQSMSPVIVLVVTSSSSWHSRQLLSHQMSCFSAVQMCLNLTTSFLELSDSVDSLINPRPHSTTAVLSVAWGPPTEREQCPLETSLQVALEGRVTTEQWSLVSSATAWPYDACRQDIQNTQQRGRHLIPLTRACHEVAHKLASQRYYNISITSINVSVVLPHEPMR